MLVAIDLKTATSTAATLALSRRLTIDWAKMGAPSKPDEQMATLTHTARLADIWHGGKIATIQLRFVSPDRVADAGGRGIACTIAK